MLFNELALCHYLLENGFVNHRQVVDEQIKITRHFSRNRNFKVILSDGNGYLVKQPRISFYLSKSALKREADVYWLAFNDEDFYSLRNFIPQFLHYDAEVQVLLTGLVFPASNLYDYHVSANAYPENIAIKQAEILAALHSITFNKIENKKSASLFPKKTNWLFNIEKEDGWWGGRKTAAELKLMDIVQSNLDILKCVGAAKEKWEMTCMLHNDIRWSNFLVAENQSGALEIKLIDWELADFGDPCWDVAGILQGYFTHWVLQNEAGPFQMLKMKPAILTFANSYCELMKKTNAESLAFLQKSMEYCGVRLLQSCIEHVSTHNDLDQKTLRLLQFALNILKKPGAGMP